MKIRIHDAGDGKTLRFAIPTRILMTRPFAWILSKALKNGMHFQWHSHRYHDDGTEEEEDRETRVELTTEQIHRLLLALYQARSLMGKEPLVDIRSHDGDIVEIWP